MLLTVQYCAVKKIVVKKLAKISRVSRKFFDVFAKKIKIFGLAWTCSDALGCIRMRSDASGCVRMRSDTSGKFRKISSKNQFFYMFANFLRTYAKTDVTSSFFDTFCSRWTYFELDTTLGAHLGIEY